MTRILDDVKLDFKDVLILPKRSELSSRSQVCLERTFTFKHTSHTWTGTGIIASNMDGVGTPSVASVFAKHNLLTALVKHYPNEQLLPVFQKFPDNVIYSLGISDDDLDKYNKFKLQHQPKFVMIDVANGYSQKFVSFVRQFKDDNPDIVLIAGNIVTPEMAEELILSGVSVAKAGIGSGSACSTRVKTGVGYPQLSAVLEVADAVHGIGGHMISDGGITCPGDMAKAFAAGADMLMAGSFFSGTYEGGGEISYKDNAPHSVKFYGMSSKTAQEAHGASLADYRASEGRVLTVPFKGPMEPILLDLLGSLRSTCTYVGAKTLKELPKRTTFVRVNQQIATLYGVGELMS